MKILLSTSYLPPISYLSLFFQNGKMIMDQWEYFQKQSFRNRAYILSPQGLQLLTVPIQKDSRRKVPMGEVRISNEFNWQKIHWMSLQSCYRRSSYFEFYEDSFSKFYQKKYEFIWDFNEDLLRFILSKYEMENIIFETTKEYKLENNFDILDFRENIHPKKPLKFKSEPYSQVFNPQGLFQEKLSVLDLLFNHGKESRTYLKDLGRVFLHSMNLETRPRP